MAISTVTGTAIVNSGAPVSFHWNNPGVVGTTPTVLPATPIDLEVEVRGGSQHFQRARFFLDGADNLGYGNASTQGIGTGRTTTFELHTDAPVTAGPGDHTISIQVLDNHGQEYWAMFTFRVGAGGGGGPVGACIINIDNPNPGSTMGYGSVGTLDATVTGGVPTGHTIRWTLDGTQVGNGNNLAHTFSQAPGAHNLIARVVDAAGNAKCSAVCNFNIGQLTCIIISPHHNQIFQPNDPVHLEAQPMAGVNPSNYVWTLPDGTTTNGNPAITHANWPPFGPNKIIRLTIRDSAGNTEMCSVRVIYGRGGTTPAAGTTPAVATTPAAGTTPAVATTPAAGTTPAISRRRCERINLRIDSNYRARTWRNVYPKHSEWYDNATEVWFRPNLRADRARANGVFFTAHNFTPGGNEDWFNFTYEIRYRANAVQPWQTIEDHEFDPTPGGAGSKQNINGGWSLRAHLLQYNFHVGHEAYHIRIKGLARGGRRNNETLFVRFNIPDNAPNGFYQIRVLGKNDKCQHLLPPVPATHHFQIGNAGPRPIPIGPNYNIVADPMVLRPGATTQITINAIEGQFNETPHDIITVVNIRNNENVTARIRARDSNQIHAEATIPETWQPGDDLRVDANLNMV
jgi:hypothetical protein